MLVCAPWQVVSPWDSPWAAINRTLLYIHYPSPLSNFCPNVHSRTVITYLPLLFALLSELPTPQVITAMDLPPIPRPPGTPIPPSPLSDDPPPFYPPANVNHLVPTDSRRSSVAFIDPYGTPPASPRFAPGPPRSDSPWDSAGAASSGGSSAASPAINPMRKPPFSFQPTLASNGPAQSKPVRSTYLLHIYLR